MGIKFLKFNLSHFSHFLVLLSSQELFGAGYIAECQLIFLIRFDNRLKILIFFVQFDIPVHIRENVGFGKKLSHLYETCFHTLQPLKNHVVRHNLIIFRVQR